jgi:uncharacterized protein YecT (DUF1311 family)
MLRDCLVLSAFVIFVVLSVRAQDEKTCYAGDVDRRQCFARVLKQADLDLNDSCTHYKRIFDAQDRANLVAAQRAWRAYRDAACNAEYDFYRDENLRWECLIKLTRRRLQDIGDLYNPPCVGPPDDSEIPPVIPVPIDLRPLSFIWSSADAQSSPARH